MQPCPAMQNGHSAHPVWMLIQHQHVEWLAEAPQECQAHMMKVPGTIQGQPRMVVLSLPRSIGKRLFKTTKYAEATGKPNSWSPVLERNYFRFAFCDHCALSD